MENLNIFWIDRFLEIFALFILGFVAFQRKRPLFFTVVLLLNTLPDLLIIQPSQQIHWITPPALASTTPHPNWLTTLHNTPPQSVTTTLLHPLIKKIPVSDPIPIESQGADEFNQIAFFLRIGFLVGVLLLFLVDHVHGVAGLAAFLFPTFYSLHRLFQFFDMILPFQMARQFALFRQNPKDYYNSLTANPSGMWMFVVALGLICAGLLILFYFTRKQSRTYNVHIPNPENYQVMLDNKRCNYSVVADGLIVETMHFKRSDAFHNQTNRLELHFISGTVLKFVKRIE